MSFSFMAIIKYLRHLTWKEKKCLLWLTALDVPAHLWLVILIALKPVVRRQIMQELVEHSHFPHGQGH